MFWHGEAVPIFNEAIHKNVVLVFGSNPQGRHGKGLALFARTHWGAQYGIGRGLQGNSYGLVTKSLQPNYTEPSTGIIYKFYGGLPEHMIIENIRELYNVCIMCPSRTFIIPYIDGASNLSGYTSEQLMNMFVTMQNMVPPNVWFHESFKRYENIIHSKRFIC